jgi:hypothetical protein
VLLVVALAGCGGGGGEASGRGRLPAGEFTRQAEAICVRAKAGHTPQTVRRMLDELAELNPPAVTEKEFAALLRSGRAYLKVISEPVEDGPLKLDDPLGDKFTADAKAVGLPRCADVVTST